MSALSWLQDLPENFDATPEIEDVINRIARLSRTDLTVRDALYEALAYRIRGLARGACYRASTISACDAEDVMQETFVIYCDLLKSWDGERSFLGYLYTRLPWRLARALDVLERGASISRSVIQDVDELPDRYLPERDALFLSEIEAGLAARDRVLLRLHIGYGFSLAEIARRRGANLRTVHRRWARIRETLRHGGRGTRSRQARSRRRMAARQ